ncbi:hypothetical protein KFU94_22215 [Chloroflexi bacterium TSY]|nr:hypothetical protein [Chloroflexi bacterium TSY]
MTSQQETNDFKSWHLALTEDQLEPDQLAILQKMVDDGDAQDLEAAARLLDWQQSFIDSNEHMYGF